METELITQYDTRKSFYNKASVEIKDGVINLWSYNTLVAFIDGDIVKVNGWYSNTTGRHIKEFLLQYGKKAESKKQILEDYY